MRHWRFLRRCWCRSSSGTWRHVDCYIYRHIWVAFCLHLGVFGPCKWRQTSSKTSATIRQYIYIYMYIYIYISNATTCPLRLRGLPPHPPAVAECNRLLKLGRPAGAVTLSRWEWWWNERWIWGARGALNLISTNYPDHGHHGRLPLSRKNAHGRAGNRNRDLIVNSQELWPPSHKAGHIMYNIDIDSVKDIAFFSDVSPCNLVDRSQHLEATCYLLQGGRV